jgi:hypothetical protein
MRVGVQFTGDLEPNQTRRWFTFNWPEPWHVAWYVMPITPALGAPEVEWDVAVERADPQHVTYWITVKNLTGQPVNFEARYAVLN